MSKRDRCPFCPGRQERLRLRQARLHGRLLGYRLLTFRRRLSNWNSTTGDKEWGDLPRKLDGNDKRATNFDRQGREGNHLEAVNDLYRYGPSAQRLTHYSKAGRTIGSILPSMLVVGRVGKCRR